MDKHIRIPDSSIKIYDLLRNNGEFKENHQAILSQIEEVVNNGDENFYEDLLESAKLVVSEGELEITKLFLPFLEDLEDLLYIACSNNYNRLFNYIYSEYKKRNSQKGNILSLYNYASTYGFKDIAEDLWKDDDVKKCVYADSLSEDFEFVYKQY